MLETVDKQRMNYICNKIVDNEKIIENNAKFWTLYLDNQLKEFVILYNFNFFEVANRFHGFISMDKRYEFNENEIRRHWSFLHAMRYLNLTVDNEYYLLLKKKYNIQEEIKEKKLMEEENRRKEDLKEIRRIEEEEDEKRNQDNIQKVKYERFNLITIDTNNSKGGLNDNKNGNEKDKEETVNQKYKDYRNINNNIYDNENEERIELQAKEDIQETAKDNANNSNECKFVGNSASDLFESDDFINGIFKNQNKLKEITKVDDDLNNLKADDDKIESYEANLFPISTFPKTLIETKVNCFDKKTSENSGLRKFNQQDSEYGYKQGLGMEKDLENTRSIEDVIRDDNKLKEQYENLDTYYNFAVKSLNYFIPKLGKGLDNEQTSEDDPAKNTVNNFQDDVIKKTSFKINQLLMDSVNEASNRYGLEEYKKKLDEEEAQPNNSLIIPNQNKNELKNIEEPNDDDQERKMSAFKAYMFSEAKNITTPDLLGKIVSIINSTYLDEVRLKNEKESNDDENDCEDKINDSEEPTCVEKKASQIETEKENPTKKNVYYYKGVAYQRDKPMNQLNDSDDSYNEDD